MLIEKAHTTHRMNSWKRSKVNAGLILCIYNRCVGWVVNIYYALWLRDSLLLAHCCFGRSCFPNAQPLVVGHILPKLILSQLLYTEGIGRHITFQYKTVRVDLRSRTMWSQSILRISILRISVVVVSVPCCYYFKRTRWKCDFFFFNFVNRSHKTKESLT